MRKQVYALCMMIVVAFVFTINVQAQSAQNDVVTFDVKNIKAQTTKKAEIAKKNLNTLKGKQIKGTFNKKVKIMPPKN